MNFLKGWIRMTDKEYLEPSILGELKQHVFKQLDHTNDLRMIGNVSEYEEAVNIGRYQTYTEIWCLIGYLERKYKHNV